ncbi:ribbon-helix-helix protein, CopG family [Mesorhizobium sp. M0913]|uniref:ribbon-helix-helix protein, CopG family n=1 Tax=Mesorhizobium sp. M0913 TaxID=2957026 RepID=UPI00333743FC
MINLSKHRVVFYLPDSLLDFLDEEVARTGHVRSVILRQALGLRKSQRRRVEADADSLFEPAGAC